MKVTFRDLVNPSIINDESYVGFQGDSEFVDQTGELRFGTWTFKNALHMPNDPDYNDKTLDSTVHENLLFGAYNPFRVYNDHGVLCIIEIQYHRETPLP